MWASALCLLPLRLLSEYIMIVSLLEQNLTLVSFHPFFS